MFLAAASSSVDGFVGSTSKFHSNVVNFQQNPHNIETQ